MEETITVSTCCKADALEDSKINERDHHEQIDIYVCEDRGEVVEDERDSDGNWQSGVGSETCICKKHEPDDFSGSSNEDR